MKNTRITDRALLGYAKGSCTREECAAIEEEFSRSPELRARLKLLKALPAAHEADELDEATWERIEAEVMRAWRVEQNAPSPSRPRWVLKTAFAAGFAVVLAVLLAFWLLEPDEEAGAPSLAVSPEITFDVGRFAPTRRSVPLSIDETGGEHVISVHSLARGFGQAGDELTTASDGVILLTLDKRARLTMLPNSTLRLYDYRGRILPYLVRGTLACDVEHDARNPFIVLAERARIVDVGTRFALRISGPDHYAVDVYEGSVEIERPARPAALVRAGQSATWQAPSPLPVHVMNGQLAPDAAKEAEKVLSVFRKKIQIPAIHRKPRKERKSLTPARKEMLGPSDRKSAITRVDLAETEVAKTSWQKSREQMTMMERDAIDSFYKTVDKQMAGGYTLRAIENLKNFLSQHSGPESEKALFLLGECHYNVDEYAEALDAYMRYLQRFPNGTWVEIAKLRFSRISEELRK